MPDRSRKRPRDPNQLARLVVGIATGETDDSAKIGGKNPAAIALGRLGGQKGGAARAASLSVKRRRQIAKLAAAKRWGKSRET